MHRPMLLFIVIFFTLFEFSECYTLFGRGVSNQRMIRRLQAKLVMVILRINNFIFSNYLQDYSAAAIKEIIKALFYTNYDRGGCSI